MGFGGTHGGRGTLPTETRLSPHMAQAERRAANLPAVTPEADPPAPDQSADPRLLWPLQENQLQDPRDWPLSPVSHVETADLRPNKSLELYQKLHNLVRG